MRYAYQNSGGQMIRWGRSAPAQTRAGDTVGLGSLGDPTIVMPRPGAPEPINGSYISMGCSGCSGGMAGDVDWGRTVASLPASVKIGGALALAYLLHKHLKKRR